MCKDHFAGLNDDLNAAPAPRRRDPNAFANTKAEGQFTEPCPKCRGTGRFVSWSGRLLGSCFACKGKGHLVFKTSPETRKAQADARDARKERAAAERRASIEQFCKDYPAIAAWIEESKASFEFAGAMGEALLKFGSLTPNQIAACERCIAGKAKAIEARKAREDAAPAISIERIEQAFAAAKAAGLKRPRLDLGAFRFKPAGENSKNAGALYVTEAGDYLGKIVGGRFLATRECGDDRQARIIAAAADPEAAAVAHGKETGSCSCCGRHLENEESVKRGIGPICAEKYGW